MSEVGAQLELGAISRPPTPPTSATLWAVPSWASITVLVSGVLLGLSSAGLVLAAMRASQPYWMLLGMELCIALAASLAVLFGRGLFRDGPGLALACIAGTTFVAGFLGWLSVQRGDFDTGGMTMSSGGVLSLNAWLVGRVLLSLLLGLVAAWLVLSRNVQSWRYVTWAALTGVPLAGLSALALFGRSWLRGNSAIPTWITWLGASVLAVLILGLFCACVHCVIRAFEMGRVRRESAPSPAPSPSTPA